MDFIRVPIVQKIGIYALYNKKNEKYYIGSSTNIYQRLIRYFYTYKYLSKKLAKDVNIYGYDSFDIIILETFDNNTITDKELRLKEYEYIKKYDSIKNGYNSNPPRMMVGRVDQNKKLECKKIKPRYIDLYINEFDLYFYNHKHLFNLIRKYNLFDDIIKYIVERIKECENIDKI